MRSAVPQFEGSRTMFRCATFTVVLSFGAVFAGPVGAEPGDNSLESANPATQQAAGQSFDTAAISSSGRYVAFDSDASTLIAGDANGWIDVFVRDRSTGILERVSVGVGGIEPNGGSYSPAISGDGRYVAFLSWASNVVANDTNDDADVFVYDRSTGSTRRASVAPGGGNLLTWANFGVGGMSDDGRYVTFECFGGIFVRDMVAGTTLLVADLRYPTTAPVISGNGRYVLYMHPLGPQLYVYDRQDATTQLLSAGGASERYFRPSVSRDGRWVAYASVVSEVAADTNQNVDVYLLDRSTGVKRLASVSASGQQTSAFSLEPAVSDDGRYVAFRSYGAGLQGSAPASTLNLLVKDMQTGFVEFVASANFNDGISLSSDGRLVAFNTTDALVVQDRNVSSDTYVHETGKSSTLPEVYNFYLRPLRIDFGAVAVSTSKTKGFQLTNAGTTALPVSLVELTGTNRLQFTLKSYCKSMLPAGEKCWISVTFRPTTLGAKEAQLHVVAGGLERYRALTGTGVR